MYCPRYLNDIATALQPIFASLQAGLANRAVPVVQSVLDQCIAVSNSQRLDVQLRDHREGVLADVRQHVTSALEDFWKCDLWETNVRQYSLANIPKWFDQILCPIDRCFLRAYLFVSVLISFKYCESTGSEGSVASWSRESAAIAWTRTAGILSIVRSIMTLFNLSNSSSLKLRHKYAH